VGRFASVSLLLFKCRELFLNPARPWRNSENCPHYSAIHTDCCPIRGGRGFASHVGYQGPTAGLAGCAGVWICEGVLIVLIASIEACEILFDEEGERSESSQADFFGDSDLIRHTPHIHLVGWK